MTSETPTGIQAISQSDIHRITSGQVVLDIQSAVKELVENALDAGARAIEIRFKEYGAESIEVIDNGSGISSENYESLALKHHTSKLTSFQDLTSVQTFGFRGEALSSLCELSTLQVTTATKEEEPVGTVLEYSRDGTLQSQDKRVARQRGTTVLITELFSTLPVRRRELLKNIKREFAKAQALLQAYAIISRGVRWVVSNSVKGRRTNIMSITGSVSSDFIQSNVVSVFGSKSCTSLHPLDLNIIIPQSKGTVGLRKHYIPGEEDDPVDELDDDEASATIHLQGLISRPAHGSGRTASDRIFLYINGRPWDSSRIVRAINEVYKSFNGNQFPMVVANFSLEGDKYDVNVSPDKRTLFLHDENGIIEGLKTSLETFFTPFQSTFTVNGANMSATKDAATQSRLSFKSKREPAKDNIEQDKDHEQSNEDEPFIGTQSTIQADSDEEEEEDLEPRFAKKRRIDTDDDDEVVNENQTSDSSVFESQQSMPEVELVDDHDEDDDEDDDDDDVEKEHVFNTSLASWSNKTRRLQDSNQTQSSGSDKITTSRTGRNANPSTIEAKVSGGPSPLKKLTDRLKSFAAPKAAMTEEGKESDSAMEKESEDEDALEYHEEGLSEQQKVEVELQRKEYQKEADLDDELDEEDEEEAEAEEEREANLSRLEEQAEGQESNSNDLDGWKSEIINHIENGKGGFEINMSVEELRQRLHRRAESLSWRQPLEQSVGHQFDHAGIEEGDSEVVEVALSRSIEKSDFEAMDIIGQFNLGFILVRRRKEKEDDVFIVDQHAADEKFNYETLQRDTKLKTQALIRPRLLELASSVEFVAAQHTETLASHGFTIRVNEEAMPGSRVELLALPISKNITFGVADLEELLHRLAEVTPNSNRAQTIRCSKWQNMLASRACRKSVMIGKALTLRQMKVILRHMGEIDQPWNCPHGRPTMRHLHQLDVYPQSIHEETSSINWHSLV